MSFLSCIPCNPKTTTAAATTTNKQRLWRGRRRLGDVPSKHLPERDARAGVRRLLSENWRSCIYCLLALHLRRNEIRRHRRHSRRDILCHPMSSRASLTRSSTRKAWRQAAEVAGSGQTGRLWSSPPVTLATPHGESSPHPLRTEEMRDEGNSVWWGGAGEAARGFTCYSGFVYFWRCGRHADYSKRCTTGSSDKQENVLHIQKIINNICCVSFFFSRPQRSFFPFLSSWLFSLVSIYSWSR